MDNAPLDLIGKLMITRELAFGDGKIDLFGLRMVLPPARFFSEYIRLSNNSAQSAALLYEAARVSFREGIVKRAGAKFSFGVNDFFKWLPGIGSMAGWGRITIVELFAEKQYGMVRVENSPVVADLRGKIRGPVDHALAGFMCGGAEAVLQTQMRCIEEECAVDGASMCRFVFRADK